MKRSFMAFGLILLLLPLGAGADDVTGKLGVGFEFGTQKMVGGQRDYSDVHHNISGHIRYGLAPHWSLELGYKGGWSHPGVSAFGEDAGFTIDSTQRLYNVFHQPRIGVLYHLTPMKSVSPYAQLSLGMMHQYTLDRRFVKHFKGPFVEGPLSIGYNEDGELVNLDEWSFSGFAGLGLEWFMTPSWAWNAGARYHFFPSEIDNVGLSNPFIWGKYHVDANDAMWEAQLGFTIFFGDRGKEMTPPPPVTPVKPAEPAKPAERGDRDGDGIYDDVDKCPDQPEDFDGYEDKDGCPDPDNDGDGVLDGKDRCPDTPKGTKVDEHGCPEQARPAIILKGVNFASDSAELSPRAKTILDDVAKTLGDYDDILIEVRGHTDSQNTDDYNMKLSLARAQSVKDYLISKGIAASRITVKGFGESMPIATNDTDEGRALNRRVEIQIVE